MFIGELFYPSWQPEPYLHLSQMAYQGLCGSGSNGEGGGSLSEGALRCANDLACALQRVARTEEARALFEAALRDAEAALGPNHMHTMSLMGNLASLYKDVGQLDAALEVMADLGVDDVAVVGVAKGPDRDAGLERFFMEGKTPFMLEPKDPVLYYLQRLRDEAHRFANGAHRTRRSMDIKKNPLDEIEGVGPGRKRALLHAFGSARGVSRAAVADLIKVDGVNDALAQRIHDHFRKGA